MICEFCSKVLTSGDSFGLHHTDASEFEKSASILAKDQRCVICWRLAQNLFEHESTIASWFNSTEPGSGQAPSLPVYRWSLRKAAKIDEMDDCFILTFRVILFGETIANKYKKRDDVPDVSFYLFRDKGRLTPRNNFPLLILLAHSSIYTDLGPMPALSSTTQESSHRIKAWVSNCAANHPKCRRNIGNFTPDRLLDVGQDSNPVLHPDSRLRVIETKGSSKRYATLSHSWGRPPWHFPQLLNKKDATFSEFTTKGVLWKDILDNSQNFAQAVEVARQLEIGYIWIDSLCIIQDDLDDWNAQAPLMHKVYRHSRCNIAASASAVPMEGLFRKRTGAYEGQLMAVAAIKGDNWRVVPGDLWQDDLLGSKLYTRGWVFQGMCRDERVRLLLIQLGASERMLSPRMLHYGEHQIFWDCATESACEAFPNRIPRQIDTAAAIDRNWRERLQTEGLNAQSTDPATSSTLFWKNAVRTYTACALTKHTDKLKAIWGIARLVRDVRQDDYGAGLWMWQLHEQLAWIVEDNSQASRDDGPAPSWSWASINNGTVLVADQRSDHERFYRVEDPAGGPVMLQLVNRLYAAGAEETKVKSRVDQEPQLKSRAIRMRCLMSLGKATLSSIDENKKQGLVLPEQIRATPGLEVYIDATKESAKDYAFLVLAATKQDVPEFENGVPIYSTAANKPKKEEFSGTGLLVEPVAEGNFYRRAGAFKFQQLSRATWVQICQACGQDWESSDGFDNGGFKDIRLE